MTKKTYYEKQGRRYVPVHEYDSDWTYSYPAGHHLMYIVPGGTSVRYNVDPAYAQVLAAIKCAENAIIGRISQAAEMKPSKKPVTQRQIDAWRELQAAMGTDSLTLQGNSSYDVVRAAEEAILKEVEVLMENPAVKDAYDQFMMLCELSKQNKS